MTSPLNNLTDTWNNSGTVFSALKYNVTNTASAAGSALFDFQVGGFSLFTAYKGGMFAVYNAFTNLSNYERGVFDWTTTSNTLTIGTQALGTGTVRNINFIIGSNTAESLSAHAGTFSCAGTEVCGYGDTFLDATNKFGIANNAVLGFSSSGSALGTMDTAVSRSAAGVIAFGSGAVGNGSACIVAKTKAGAFTTSDVPASSWVVGRDTSGATTKLYYNNAGTLMTVALT